MNIPRFIIACLALILALVGATLIGCAIAATSNPPVAWIATFTGVLSYPFGIGILIQIREDVRNQ